MKYVWKKLNQPIVVLKINNFNVVDIKIIFAIIHITNNEF